MSRPNEKQVNWNFPGKLAVLFQPHRYKVLHGGRGGAKTWGIARALLIIGAQRKIHVVCCREIQKSIKDSVHKTLSDQIEELGLIGVYDVLASEIRGKNGTTFIFVGLSGQTRDSIKSLEGADYCWMEEAQSVVRRSWDILVPTIRKDGSEIWVSFNPDMDSDETWIRFVENHREDAVVIEINWEDNPWFPAVLEIERKEFLRLVALGARTQDEYDNIWEGKCKSAVDGAIYFREVTAAKQKGQLCNVPYDPRLKVHTVWDLGRADLMSVIFVQKSASEVRIIDYIEDSHRDLADYVRSETGREDLASRKYNWGKDYLPHDGNHKTILNKLSAIEILKSMGRDALAVDEIGIEPGIAAARLMFRRVVFDKTKAAVLFNRLARYKRVVNQSTQMGGAPFHDIESHGADAFRYLAVCETQMSNENVKIIDPYAGFRRA